MTVDHQEKTLEGWKYVSKGFIQGENTHLPEINDYAISVGDYLLLCSDGLYDCFTTEEITHLLEMASDIDEMCAILQKRGKEKSRDNYSAIIIKVVDI